MSLIADIALGAVQGLAAPIAGVFNTFINRKADTAIEIGKQDVSIIESRNNLLGQIHKDPAIAIGWYLFIVPTGLWFAGIVAYCLISPWVPWWQIVKALPPNIEYIPYAVVTFLFGLAWRGKL